MQIALDGRGQAWLAEKTGLSTSTIHDYARGAIPSADRAFLIARTLGVDAEWLVTGEKTGERPEPEPPAELLLRVGQAEIMNGLDPALRARIRAKGPAMEYLLLDCHGRDHRFLFVTPMPAGGFPEIAAEGAPILCAAATELAPEAYYLARIADRIEIRQFTARDGGLLVANAADAEPISAPFLRQEAPPPFVVARVLGTVFKLV